MNQKVYMTDREFTAHMAALIPTPSAEVNDILLGLAHSLRFELKEDLYHTFSFISRHFTSETLQRVYDLCKGKDQGILPWSWWVRQFTSRQGHPRRRLANSSGRIFGSCPHRRPLTRSVPWASARCGGMKRKRGCTPSTSAVRSPRAAG